jgi:hypothetical protein
MLAEAETVWRNKWRSFPPGSDLAGVQQWVEGLIGGNKVLDVSQRKLYFIGCGTWRDVIILELQVTSNLT